MRQYLQWVFLQLRVSTKIMNDRSIVPPSQPGGEQMWPDAYMPEGQVGFYGQPAPSGTRSTLFNFASLRGIIYRQRWLFCGVLILALVIGLVMTLLVTPVYRAEAKVTVRPLGQSVVEGQESNAGFSPMQIYDYLATQAEVIKSRSLAAVVVADLNLVNRTDLLGTEIEESRAPGMSDAKWLKEKEAIAITQLTQNVTAEQLGRNWVLTIGYESQSPTLAAEVANGFADAFVATGSRNSIESNRYALEYLKQQIGETRQKLAEAEQVSNSYARNSGIILEPSTSDEGGPSSTLTATNLASINARVASARAARIEAEQRWQSIQRLPAAELPEVQSSPVLQTLVSERTAKSTQLVELRQRYNDDFPQIRNLLAQIKIIDAQIEKSGTEIKASARSQFLVAQNQERALAAELSSLTEERLVEQDRQVELGGLDREATALRNQLNSLLERYNQINSAAELDPGTITKIDPAVVPGSPFSPNIPRNLGIALVLGLAVAMGLAILRETLDDRIRSLDDVEEKLGLSLLGHTPHVDDRDMATLETNRFSALMEAYSSIRTAINFSLPRSRNVIQITSTEASEGKSTTAVILAELFASLGRKTLLVDADLRRPSVASLLDIEKPKIGLVEVLLGHAELEAAVVKGTHENLDILPVGQIPPNPTEILASPEMRNFIEKYRDEYALIIFDTCPIMGLADAPIVGSLVDATVFVLEANRLPFGQVRTAVRRMGMSGSNVIGVVLTKFRALEAGESYSYQYNYYRYGHDN